jgi:sugar lactone lactonase YvrE
MDVKRVITVWTVTVSFFCLFAFAVSPHSHAGVTDFDSGQWELKDAEVTEHLGRKSLQGYAYLKDVEFENGIIEVDIAVAGGVRCYPGIVFRMQSEENYENFYIRPHRSIYYPDALQYTPNINGVGCWQLYNGEGYTAGATLPANEWIPLKMEISGVQARVYFQNMETPALVIDDLKHGVSRGTIGLLDQSKTAHFSNFRYQLDDTLPFDPPPEVEIPLGMIVNWEISQPFKMSQIDLERTPEEQGMTDLVWRRIRSEPSGLVNIARFYGRNSVEPDCIWARTMVQSGKKEIREFQFGYSDYVTVFLNGRIEFSGNSAYRSRDPSFLGIVSLNDALYLPLVNGENEILLLVTESFGGWGFMFRDADATFQHEGLTKVWEYREGIKYPEAVVYDAQRDALYISNYYSDGNEFISRMNVNGDMLTLKWVTGLDRPTGMCLYQGRLYVVERSNVAQIDIESAEIMKRYPIPEPGFPNDIAFDASGSAYISDGTKGRIYTLQQDTIEVWLEDEGIKDPNGLCVNDDLLLVGNSGDGCLKAVDVDDKQITTMASFGPGSTIDGIAMDENGNCLVSDFRGRMFLVSPAGQKTELLNTTAPNIYCADFAYVANEHLLIIPTLYDNRLVSYRLSLD